MHAIHRLHSSSVAIVVVSLFAIAMIAPLSVHAEEQAIAAAPAEPSWDETSGYGSVEAIRAASEPLVVTESPITTVPAVAPSRVIAAQRALESGDLGSLQEEALETIVAAAVSWDESSGYGSVEAIRANATKLIETSAD